MGEKSVARRRGVETTSLYPYFPAPCVFFAYICTSQTKQTKNMKHPETILITGAPLAQAFAARLLEEGIYVIGFFFPVVPRGKARIRVQISAAHEPEHLNKAVAAFTKIGKSLGVIQ
jgi:glycine C-acetyltransferase